MVLGANRPAVSLDGPGLHIERHAKEGYSLTDKAAARCTVTPHDPFRHRSGGQSGASPPCQLPRLNGWLFPTSSAFLDLFSGIGGFSLGLERTGGFETVAVLRNRTIPPPRAGEALAGGALL